MRVVRVALDGLDEARRAALGAHLSPAERARVAALRDERARQRALLARGLLRELLGRQCGCEPARLELTSGPHGKPALPPAYGLTFNLSRAGDLLLIAWARGAHPLPAPALGIDLVQRDPALDPQELRPALSPQELQAALSPQELQATLSPQELQATLSPQELRPALSPQDALNPAELAPSAEPRPAREGPPTPPTVQPAGPAAAALRAFVRKEALLKALGTGLGGPLEPTRLTLTPAPGDPWSAHDVPGWGRVWLRDLPLAPDHLAALALTGPAATPRQVELVTFGD
mgnify:CR=1 FL=1